MDLMKKTTPKAAVPDLLLTAATKVHPAIANILHELPKEVQASLVMAFHSAKTLAIALLATVQEEPTKALAFRYHIPEHWVLRYKDTCLRALRRQQASPWHPPKT